MQETLTAQTSAASTMTATTTPLSDTEPQSPLQPLLQPLEQPPCDYDGKQCDRKLSDNQEAFQPAESEEEAIQNAKSEEYTQLAATEAAARKERTELRVARRAAIKEAADKERAERDAVIKKLAIEKGVDVKDFSPRKWEKELAKASKSRLIPRGGKRKAEIGRME